MTDANTICHDVDLLGDWLDSRGYTEEAGLCLRVLGLIHEQAEENEKTKRFYIEAGLELRQLREENKRLREALKPLVAELDDCPNDDYEHALVSFADLRAAAAAYKETGDD